MASQLMPLWKEFEKKILDLFSEAYQLPLDIQALASESVECNLIHWKETLSCLALPMQSEVCQLKEQPVDVKLELEHGVVTTVVMDHNIDITSCDLDLGLSDGEQKDDLERCLELTPGCLPPIANALKKQEGEEEVEEYVACEILPLLDFLKQRDESSDPDSTKDGLDQENVLLDDGQSLELKDNVETEKKRRLSKNAVRSGSRKRKARKKHEDLDESVMEDTAAKNKRIKTEIEMEFTDIPPVKRKVGRPRKMYIGDGPEWPNQKSYSCELCGKQLYTEKGYKMHMKNHKTGATWKCQFCDKAFYTPVAYDIHESSHTNPQKCPECDYTSGSQYWIDRHVEKVHHGSKNLLCFLCAKSFKYPSALNEHLQVTHYRYGSFPCDQCLYKGASRNLLKQHIRNKHTPREPLECDICKTKLKTRSSLGRHRKKHFDTGEHSCPKCNTILKSPEMLERHEKQVHGVKLHCCDVCLKTFPSKAKLQIHQVVHTGEKAFSCDLCTYRCNVKHNLNKHYKMVHKIIISKTKPVIQKITENVSQSADQLVT